MRVGFRQASIESFLANRMELDKSVLTLSAAGLGAVLAVWTAIGVYNWIEFGVELLAAVAFTVTIGIVLRIFRKNADYTSSLIQAQAFHEPATELKRLDWWAWRIFTAGVILAMIGASLGTISKWKASKSTKPPVSAPPMTSDPKNLPVQPSTKTDAPGAPAQPPHDSARKVFNESIEGLHRLDIGSLHGLHELAPTEVKPAPAPTSEKTANPGTKKP